MQQDQAGSSSPTTATATKHYAVNPDGTGFTQLTTSKLDTGLPLPSPDGSLIAFSRPGGAAVMNADGSESRPLRGCAASTAQSWSPDSSHLACEAAGGRGLVVVNAKTGVATP
jgi:Tol biopolymer transport system component